MSDTTPLIIAVDPGLSGGIVIGNTSYTSPASVASMPETEADVVGALRAVKEIADASHQPEPWLAIEKLPLFVSVPGGRVSGASMAKLPRNAGLITGGRVSGASMAKLHRNAGLITGAALALGIRIVEIDPHSWQKHFRLGTRKSAGGYTAWKNILKGEAQKRFPSIKVTHAIADALLIWEFAKTIK